MSDNFCPQNLQWLEPHYTPQKCSSPFFLGYMYNYYKCTLKQVQIESNIDNGTFIEIKGIPTKALMELLQELWNF